MTNKFTKTGVSFFALILFLMFNSGLSAQEGNTPITLNKDSLAKLLYKHTFPDFYLGENLPEKFLEKKTKIYGVPEEEVILAFMDQSKDGKSKSGCAIGTKGLYMYNSSTCSSPGTKFIPYSKMKSHDIVKMPGKEIKIEFISIEVAGLDKKQQAEFEEILRQMKTKFLN